MPDSISTVTLEELELFFGGKADLLDPDAPWPYSKATFEFHAGPWRVHASLYVASLDIAFSISVDGHVVYELNAQQAKAIRVHRDPRSTTLEVVLSERGRIFLRLLPTPSVHQDLTDGT